MNAIDFISNRYPEYDIQKEVSSGDSFGELALLTDLRRKSTVVCKEETYVLEITKKGFEILVESY